MNKIKYRKLYKMKMIINRLIILKMRYLLQVGMMTNKMKIKYNNNKRNKIRHLMSKTKATKRKLLKIKIKIKIKNNNKSKSRGRK